MAGPDPVALETAERRLRAKVALLAQPHGRHASAALDLLTGRMTPAEWEQRLPAPAAERWTSDEPKHSPVPVAATGARGPKRDARRPTGSRRGRTLARRTVYVSDENMRDVEFILDALSAGPQRHLSRSAVFRQAIAELRAALEKGGSPRTEAKDPGA